MQISKRIEVLHYLGDYLKTNKEAIEPEVLKAKQKNQWFTKENIYLAIENIADKYLDKDVLHSVSNIYNIGEPKNKLNIGIIAAGNIPMVGMHDLLCTFLAGHNALVKLSEKDDVLLPYCISILQSKYPEVATYFKFVDRISAVDAVIATGSNNTSRYFEYYFSKYPHIIRKNRNSVAILDGSESDTQLKKLGKDIFSFYGLGCRNVAKIYVNTSYDLVHLMHVLSEYQEIANHNKYKNNLDYNAAIYLLNDEEHLISEFLIIRASPSVFSRIACLHYSYYSDVNSLKTEILAVEEDIQCISTDIDIKDLKTVALGACQQPEFLDFADGVDTLQFLLDL